MDSRIEELEKRLLAAGQHAQRAEEETQRAEEEKRRAEEETRRAEAKTRNTTLFEYLHALHDLFKQFTVETDKRTTSKGPLTSPARRRCPRRLKPWEGGFP